MYVCISASSDTHETRRDPRPAAPQVLLTFALSRAGPAAALCERGHRLCVSRVCYLSLQTRRLARGARKMRAIV